jgi:hypothetical protein
MQAPASPSCRALLSYADEVIEQDDQFIFTCCHRRRTVPRNSATPTLAQQESEDELAKKLSNPISSLISVPFSKTFGLRGDVRLCYKEGDATS